MGVCPAATYEKADGFLGGINGGRACVYIAGTFCQGVEQGTFEDKEKDCVQCDFYRKMKEDHPKQMFVTQLLRYVRNHQNPSA